MELDDLKKAWKQEETAQKQNQDIVELIHQKSRGPIASLKHSFRRQMIAVAALLTAVLVSNGRNVESVPGQVLLYSYIAFALAVILAFYLNYRLTSRMEHMDKNVKTNLENYVALLEKRLKWQYLGSRLVVVVFLVMLEVLPLYYHAVSPVIRFSAYAVYLLFVYFLSRSVKQKKFGRHLAHLKEVLNDLR